MQQYIYKINSQIKIIIAKPKSNMITVTAIG